MAIEALLDPQAALILMADSTSNDPLYALAALAPQAGALSVSLTLLDRGANPETALAPSLFGNLRYVFVPDSDSQSVLSRALDCSSADFLVLVRNPLTTLGEELTEALPRMLNGTSLHLRSERVSDGHPVLERAPSPQIRRLNFKAPSGFQFAGRRRVLERLIGLLHPDDALANLEAADLAIQAGLGDELSIWDEPAMTQPPQSHHGSARAIGNGAA